MSQHKFQERPKEEVLNYNDVQIIIRESSHLDNRKRSSIQGKSEGLYAKPR